MFLFSVFAMHKSGATYNDWAYRQGEPRFRPGLHRRGVVSTMVRRIFAYLAPWSLEAEDPMGFGIP